MTVSNQKSRGACRFLIFFLKKLRIFGIYLLIYKKSVRKSSNCSDRSNYGFVSRFVAAWRSMASSTLTTSKVQMLKHLRKYRYTVKAKCPTRNLGSFVNRMAQVARELCIQTAPVEIFLIDAWMGAWEEIDYHRLGSLLNVTGDFLILLRKFCLKKLGWKRWTRDDCPTRTPITS